MTRKASSRAERHDIQSRHAAAAGRRRTDRGRHQRSGGQGVDQPLGSHDRSHHNGILPAQVDQPSTPHAEFVATLDRIGHTGLDPRYVFLDASAVMRRYGWGRTKGYQNLKNRELVPAPVMTHPDRWRLDQLLAWEDRRIAAGEDLAFDRGEKSLERLESRLPGPKRPGRKSA